jgi:SAM-dependent methyltransferase
MADHSSQDESAVLSGKAMKEILRSILGRNATSSTSGEKGAAWYDQSFDENSHWKCHYTESKYYFIWTVIADRIMRRGAGAVLDAGCGSGQLAALLRDKGVKQYCGIDFSARRIQQARLACPEFKFVNGDVFRSNVFDFFSYDTVISTEFLEHVERDIEFLKRIKSNSLFIGTVPNFPFESHVRHFTSQAEVRERYAPHFKEFSVDFFYGNDRGQTYFLIEGILP